MTLFGQSCLAARRLVEAGTRFVSVFWDEYGLAGDAWDTHFNHFPRMIDQLLPTFDLRVFGPDSRPGTPRPARRHAGGLHQRARPHAEAGQT